MSREGVTTAPHHNPRATWWAAKAFLIGLEQEFLLSPGDRDPARLRALWVAYSRRCEDRGVNVPVRVDGDTHARP